MSETTAKHAAANEWFYITPDGENVVTRYLADSEAKAWEQAAKHFCLIPADRPAWTVKAKLDGFRMSLKPPAEPKRDRWRQYNDLVTLRNALWGVVPNDGQPGAGDPRWRTLTDGFERLVDQNSRLRFWLEWVLTADAAELDQWRNGEHAANLVNRECNKNASTCP